TYHHGSWHYINYPLVFEDGVSAREPEAENIVSAFERNSAQGAAAGVSNPDKAIALCWLFHLVGDVHQPLHTTALFSREFPDGDRGGNLFKVVAGEGGRIVDLHYFWDGLVTGSEDYRQAKNLAAEIRNNPALTRERLAEFKDASFVDWARKESFTMAHDLADKNSAPKTGSTLTAPDRTNA